MKNLHICMLASEFPPNCAGIGYSAYHLSKSLLEKGHQVTVITRGKWLTSSVRLHEGITVYEVPFIPFFPPFHMLYHGYFVNKLVTKLEAKIDIFHLHSPLVPIIKTQKPIIVTIHSTWRVESQFFKRITDWYSLAVWLFKSTFIRHELKVYARAKSFITISSAMAKELTKNYLIDSAKIHIIRNSIDIKTYGLNQSLKDDKQFSVLFVGRLVYRKGVLDLIEAAKIVYQKYPDVMFYLIGAGPLEKTIKKQIKASNLGNNIKLLGNIPNQRVREYLQHTSLFILPSHYEGLPMVILEAIASGLPVVATDIDGINEVIRDNSNGLLVPSCKPRALASAIENLYLHKSLAQRLARQARKSSSQYDRSVAVNNTLKVYQDICA